MLSLPSHQFSNLNVNHECFDQAKLLITNLEILNQSYEDCVAAKLECAKVQEEKRIALAKLEESVAQINAALKRLISN